MTWIVLLGIFLCAWILLPHAVKLSQIAKLRQRCRAARLIVLSYDDGPGTRVTNEILNTLRSFGATATFFVLGRKIDALRDTAVRLIADGHEIGNHSYRHFHAWKRDPITIFLDIRRGQRAVRSLGKCRYFRAPYGKLTLASLIQVWLQGCRQSWWTIDSSDTWTRPRPVEAVLDEIRKQGGGVILLHDHDRTGNSEGAAYVVDLTRAILAMARIEQFSIIRLCELYGSTKSIDPT